MEILRHGMRSRIVLWVTASILVSMTVAVFWNVPKGEFVRWDDDIKIYRNEHLGPLTPESIRWMFTDTERLLYYAPVTWLVLSFVWQLSHLNPFGYHLASLLFHCSNALLVFFVIRQILEKLPLDPNSTEESRLSLAAGLAALFWSVHPLRVEAVAWATAISHLLAVFFVLLSLLSYLQFRNSKGKRAVVFYAASLICFIFAMLSYPVVLAFPAILVMADWFFHRCRGPALPVVSWRSLSLAWGPFAFVSVGALAITLYGRSHAVRFFAAPISMTDFSWVQRVVQAFYVWTYYLWKPLAPFHLSPMSLNLSEVNPTAPRFLIAVFFICSVTFFLWLKRKRFCGLLTLWLCYLALLVPMLGLTEYPHYTSDRYSYLPTLVSSVLLGSVLVNVFRFPSGRWLGMPLVLLLISISAALSFRQIPVWHDSRTLFRHVLSLVGDTPAAGVMHTRLGFVLADAGETDAAVLEFQAALRFYPGYWQAYAGLGNAFAAGRRIGEALDAYDKAIAANPYDAQTQFERALLLIEKGSVSQGVAGYRAGLRLEPDNIEALNNLAWILATDRDPQNRNGLEAVRLARQACQRTHFEKPVFLGTLAAAYAEAQEFDLAVQTAVKARDLALAAGEKSVADRNQELLLFYKSGKPYRE